MKKRILSLFLAVTLIAVLLPGKVFETEVKAAEIQICPISAGFKYGMAITTDGSLYTWGNNTYGELGNGTTTSSYTPQKIMDNVTAVSAGDEHSMAVTADGSLYTWGRNRSGELGNGTTTSSAEPQKIMDNVTAISAGNSHSMAITTDGSLYTWGYNYYGGLGNGTTTSSAEPQKIMDNVAAISAGFAHSMAITTDGSLYTWGLNTDGELGNGSTTNTSTPQKIMDNVIAISAGVEHSMAITNDGSLYVWGYNKYGQIGDGTNTNAYTPKKIMDNVIAASTGYWHSMAITADGSLYTWGYNTDGELGNGSTTNTSTPEKVMDNIVYATGDHHSMAVTKNGSLYAWGCDLGNGTTEDTNTPQKIMDNIMLSSNVSITSGSAENETAEEETEESAENIYTDNDVDLSFNSSSLKAVTDNESAVSLIESVVSGMSSAEIGSVKAKDQLAYLAEEAAARAATVEVEDDIVIDQENTEEALNTVSTVVNSAESVISSSNVSVKSVRSKVRYSTSKSSSVSISKENITADVDVVEAVTPFGSFEFEPDSVSELTVDSEGTNKISVSFNKNDTSSKVTVKFPNVTSDGYKAVVDEEGNVIGGKYNPITDELSAKIDESGVFTVVTNEKDFSDIKSQPAEVQNAIKKLASKGIIKGTSETEFSPDSPITRAEIAALIVRILDVDDPNADGGFTDVTKENWYFGSAGSSKRENIIAGYEDNTFRGTVVIPKVQITSVTARVLTNRLGYYSASESVLNEFTDADTIASWARSDVALAAYSNMVIRRTDGSFVPDMEVTRGDAAVILEKLFDKVW